MITLWYWIIWITKPNIIITKFFVLCFPRHCPPYLAVSPRCPLTSQSKSHAPMERKRLCNEDQTYMYLYRAIKLFMELQTCNQTYLLHALHLCTKSNRLFLRLLLALLKRLDLSCVLVRIACWSCLLAVGDSVLFGDSIVLRWSLSYLLCSTRLCLCRDSSCGNRLRLRYAALWSSTKLSAACYFIESK